MTDLATTANSNLDVTAATASANSWGLPLLNGAVRSSTCWFQVNTARTPRAISWGGTLPWGHATVGGPTLIGTVGQSHPSFALAANHLCPGGQALIGTTPTWLTDAGTGTETGTIAAAQQIGLTDLLLLMMSAPVVGVTGAALPPANLGDLMAMPCAGVAVLADYSNAVVRVQEYDVSSFSADGAYLNVSTPTDENLIPFNGPVNVGASGSPLFLTQVTASLAGILLGVFSSARSVASPMAYLSQINAAMTAMAGS